MSLSSLYKAKRTLLRIAGLYFSSDAPPVAELKQKKTHKSSVTSFRIVSNLDKRDRRLLFGIKKL